MKSVLTLLFSIIALISAFSQPQDGLIAYYSFNNCDATEDTGSGANGVITGNATCGCGVLSNGLQFDGNTNVQILGNLDLLFGKDFTISFFILPNPQSNSTMDILSKSVACGIDSTVELRYNPVGKEINLTLSQHGGFLVTTAYSLPTNRCYHHIAFVRKNRELRLYYDGTQVALSPSAALVSIFNNGILTLGGGPCLANGEVPFKGVLDELRLYNRALTTSEVKELYSPIDIITSPDTVLFTGTSMQVRLPVTCASSISWVPTTGVSIPNSATPELSPLTSTTYHVNMDYGYCQSTDSLHVTIADSSDLSCDKVFFPTGFTPNGDNVNDDWGMSNIVFLGEFGTLKVFDRWGGEVFESNNQNDRWDGSRKGDKLMPGQYVYQFTYSCEGKERRKTGSVTMIR